MARAEVTRPLAEITLTLTEEEARALQGLMAQTSAGAFDGAFYNIYCALDDAGVEPIPMTVELSSSGTVIPG